MASDLFSISLVCSLSLCFSTLSECCLVTLWVPVGNLVHHTRSLLTLWVSCNFPDPIGNSWFLLTCHCVLIVCIFTLPAGSLVTKCVLESYVILEAAPTIYPDLHYLSIMAFVDRPAMVMEPTFQGVTLLSWWTYKNKYVCIVLQVNRTVSTRRHCCISYSSYKIYIKNPHFFIYFILKLFVSIN